MSTRFPVLASAVMAFGGVAVAQTPPDTHDAALDDPAPAAGSPVKFSVLAGFDFSNGDFGGDADTRTLSTPVSVRADVGDFRFSVSGAWLEIRGPGGVVGDGVIVDADALGEIETNSGFGDLTLGVNYDIPTSLTGKWLVQLQGRVKIPTADEDQGLGTGEVDGGIAVDLAYDFGKFTPFTTLGYRFRGDPEGADLNNTFSLSVGGSYALGGGYAVLGSYDFREATTDGSDSSSEFFGAVTGPITDKVRWTIYGSGGITDGAPDVGAGFQLSVKL